MSTPDSADLAGFLKLAGVIGLATFPIVYWYLGSHHVHEQYANPKRLFVALLAPTLGILVLLAFASLGQMN